MITWIRPTGSKIETNELKGTIEHCVSMGWYREDGTKPEKEFEFDSRGVPWDAKIHAKSKTKYKNGAWRYRFGMNAKRAAPIEAASIIAAES